MNSEKVCPLMSKAYDHAEFVDTIHIAYCVESQCALWIKPYSTEHLQQDGGCAIAYQPLMVDGLMRV